MRKRPAPIAKICLPVVLFILMSMSVTAEAGSVTKERVTFSVTLSDNQEYTIVGYMYYEGNNHKNRTIQVLLPGMSYDHRYFDAPRINDHSYSYARYMARRGYTVLAYDPLGTGESDTPDGDFINVPEAALAVRQVIGDLRAMGGHHRPDFRKVVLVGHSLGSHVGVYSEGVLGNSVDGLVVTGLSVTPGAIPFPPGSFDALLTTPYILIDPALRAAGGFYAPNVDQAVLDYDGANLNQLISRGAYRSFDSFLADANFLHASSVTAHVLVQLADHDGAYPLDRITDEAANYSSAESVTVQVLQDMGHTINMHLNNKVSWRQINEWIDDTI